MCAEICCEIGVFEKAKIKVREKPQRIRGRSEGGQEVERARTRPKHTILGNWLGMQRQRHIQKM